MAASKALPNGAAEKATTTEPSSSIPSVVGINFGDSYASIAVFTKEGLAECIANEDGERQIACAISFNGEEVYIGNQAKVQLVKNAKNTITGFRNLLGKKFSEISKTDSPSSAPVIQHPDIPDEPAYKVEVLQPAPSPLPTSHGTSTLNTPAGSHLPTPRSEPLATTRILTPSSATTMFIASLVKSAEAFLGKKVTGAVITVPSFFTPVQRTALEEAASAAGVNVLQLLDEASAAAATTTSPLWSPELAADRTQLVVDVGASLLTLTLLSLREGLAYVLASSTTPSVGGSKIDEALIKFFATDFTKKSKIPLNLTGNTDQRALTKLLLALEHTKRTISASPGAATISVESLKDGVDYTGSINRMRFDLIARPVYSSISTAISNLLSSVGIDAHEVDEIVYVGGTGCLPGLDEHLCVSCGFREDVDTPFARGTVVGGGIGDPTTVLSRGCATQAALIASIPDDKEHAELRAAFTHETRANEVKATTSTVGVLFPSNDDNEMGGTWIPIIYRETALPARRTVSFDVGLPDGEPKRFAFEVWEVKEGIRVEKVKPPPVETSDDEDEEEEEIEVKHRVTKKEKLLGAAEVHAQLGMQTKGKSADAGKWTTTVQVQFVIGIDGDLEVEVKEIGKDGAVASVKVAAP